jgi:DNA (cytosine-5)-methyltransferase 1
MLSDNRPLLLDLFCGAGGAAKGYHDAGFRVIGVDIHPQPHFPYEFIQADALAFLDRMIAGGTWDWIGPGIISAIHASPPCQRYSDLAKRNRNADAWPDLISPTRDRLILLAERWGMPYVIENVEGAPLLDPITLCGTMFPHLRVLRHRLFESNVRIHAGSHGRHPLVFTHDKRKAHYGRLDQDTAFVQVTGGGNAWLSNKLDAMGIDWMRSHHEVNEAIPPAYTEWIGSQLYEQLRSPAA